MFGGHTSENMDTEEIWQKKDFDSALADAVNSFADRNPEGTYILALSGHVVCVQDGTIYDTWDSGNEIVLYFWEKG